MVKKHTRSLFFEVLVHQPTVVILNIFEMSSAFIFKDKKFFQLNFIIEHIYGYIIRHY